jgi:hypothetical protein
VGRRRWGFFSIFRRRRFCSAVASASPPPLPPIMDAASANAFTGAPHDNTAADEDSGQCITHHEELATACAWTFDGQQLVSISDAGVMSSRRAPDAPPSVAAAHGGDDEETLDGT